MIADAWDCPIGTIHSKDIFRGHPAEGKDRQGAFIVLHGHSPPERVNKKDGDFCLFIYRDPRDLIVSISHYFDRPLDECINDAINGRDAKGPLRFPIAEYVKMWLTSEKTDFSVRYEDLHASAETILRDIWEMLEVNPVHDLAAVIERQSFAQRKSAPAFDPEYHQKHMRKGVVGDWKNHLTPEQQQRVEAGIDGMGYW